jgi:transcriptional regulator with XRE-family HTH domain
MKTGSSIRRARVAAGLSQRALAERSGIDQAAIARMELGTVQPRVDTWIRLLEACGWEVYTEPTHHPDLDRHDIRKALRMTDRERERYFVESNRNMLHLMDSSR